MDVDYSLTQVLKVLRRSGLHFTAQDTPYSLFISIRKKSIQDKELSTNVAHIRGSKTEEKICDLKKQCAQLEKALDGVKNELQQEIDDHETTVMEKAKLVLQLTSKDKLNENLHKENESIKAEISDYDRDLKLMKKNLKTKDKELYDLKKESETLKENL